MIAGSVSLGLFVNHDILVGVPGKSVSALTFTSNWGEIFSGDSDFAATSPQLLRHLWFVALLAQATLVLPLSTAMLAQYRLHVRAGVGAGAARRAVRVWHVGAVQPVRRPDTRVFWHCTCTVLACCWCRAGVRRAAQRGVYAEPRRLFTMVMPWLATGALVVLIMMMPRVGQDARQRSAAV